MSVPGSRMSELLAAGQEAQVWEIGDDDVVGVALDVEDTTGLGSAGTGSVKPIRNRNAQAMMSRRRFPPVRVYPAFGEVLNTAWGYNTSTHHRMVMEESTPGNRRLWAVTVDDTRHPILQRRTVLSEGGTVPSAWATIDLTTKFTADSGVFGNDNHKTPLMHIDSDGYVHVMGGLLGNGISGHYCVSRVPYSITLSDYVPAEFESGATNDTVMTYPQSVECSDGSFVLLHRDSANVTGGGPGKTEFFVRRYIPNGSAPPASGANSRWQTRVKLIDGDSDPNGPRGPYLWQVATDPNDRATHWLFFCWRVESTNFNERFACIVTHDDFATFELADGTPVTLPLDTTDYTGAMVVDDLSETFATFINVGGVCVDARGRPHAVYFKAVSALATYHTAYWDGTDWVVTSLGRFGTTPNRASIIADPHGRAYVVFNQQGATRIVDVTPGDSYLGDAVICDFGFQGAELSIAQQPVLDFNTACFVACPDGGFADDATTPDAGYYVEGFVVAIDTERLFDIASGRVAPIRPRRLPDVAVPTEGEIVVANLTTVIDLGLARVPFWSRGGSYQAKLVATGRVDASTTMTVKIGQRQVSAGTLTAVGETLVTSTTEEVIETAWLPLKTIVFLSRGDVLAMAGITTGTGKGYLRGVLQVQQIETERA